MRYWPEDFLSQPDGLLLNLQPICVPLTYVRVSTNSLSSIEFNSSMFFRELMYIWHTKMLPFL